MLVVVRPGWSWFNHEKKFTHAELEVVDVDVATLTPAQTRALTVPEGDKSIEGKNTREDLARFKALVIEQAGAERALEDEFIKARKDAADVRKDLALMRASNLALCDKIARLDADLEIARATIAALQGPTTDSQMRG